MSIIKKGLNADRDFETFKHEAAVLFIKHGMTGREICAKLNIPTGKFQKWSTAGQWQQLRPETTHKKPGPKIHEAAILYIKNGLSAIAISQALNVSVPTISKWCKEGQWEVLRPDFLVMAEYKAANLYIKEGRSACEISQLLNVQEPTIKYWIYANGWDAARLVSASTNLIADVVAAFCQHYKTMFPKQATEIEFAQIEYIKTITPKL